MAISRGFLGKFAIKKKSTAWSAVGETCNVAGLGWNIESEDIASTAEWLENDSLTGTRFRETGITSTRTVNGSVGGILQYNNAVQAYLIAQAMGRADTPQYPPGLTTLPYPYYFTYRMSSTTLDGYYSTFAFDKLQDAAEIHMVDSVASNGFEITGAAGDWCRIKFQNIGRRMYIGTSQVPNVVDANINTSSETTPRKYIAFSDLQFRIASQSGGALSATDQFYPTSFTITLGNNREGDLTSLNAPYRDEPIGNNFAEVTGSFQVPKYQTSTIEAAMLNGTIQKMDIRARSTDQITAVGGGAYYYSFEMFFPAGEVRTAPRNLAGFSKLTSDFEVTFKKADSAPDGMDGIGSLPTLSNEEARGSLTEPMTIQVMSRLSPAAFDHNA